MPQKHSIDPAIVASLVQLVGVVLAATLTDTKKVILAGFVLVSLIIIVWRMRRQQTSPEPATATNEPAGPRSVHFGPVAATLTDVVDKTRARLKEVTVTSTFTSDLRGSGRSIRDELIKDCSQGAVFIVPAANLRSNDHDALMCEVGLWLKNARVLLLSQDVGLLPTLLKESSGKLRVIEFAHPDEIEEIVVNAREFLTFGRTD
jgi:hypothetical protein